MQESLFVAKVINTTLQFPSDGDLSFSLFLSFQLIFSSFYGTKITAAVSRTAGEPLEIEEIEVAFPIDWEVRIKILCTSICHSDVTFWKLKVINSHLWGLHLDYTNQTIPNHLIRCDQHHSLFFPISPPYIIGFPSAVKYRLLQAFFLGFSAMKPWGNYELAIKKLSQVYMLCFDSGLILLEFD